MSVLRARVSRTGLRNNRCLTVCSLLSAQALIPQGRLAITSPQHLSAWIKTVIQKSRKKDSEDLYEKWSRFLPSQGLMSCTKMSDKSTYHYTLYCYFRSSCSARVRIAAHLKGIPLEYRYIHLVKNEQQSQDYHALNPSDSVPTLIVSDSQTGKEITRIRQSVAILEFFEEVETKNSVALLPDKGDPIGRARVRELVNIIASDIQPVTNLRVVNFIKPFNIEAKDWQQHFITIGFRAYDELIKAYGGKYSVGESVTLADCTLAPAIDGALRFGVDVKGKFPHVWQIWEEIKQLDAFKKGRWDNQPDTPEDLRTKE